MTTASLTVCVQPPDSALKPLRRFGTELTRLSGRYFLGLSTVASGMLQYYFRPARLVSGKRAA